MPLSIQQIKMRTIQFQVLEALGLVIRHPRPDGSADLEFPSPDDPAVAAFEDLSCTREDFLAALGPDRCKQLAATITTALRHVDAAR